MPDKNQIYLAHIIDAIEQIESYLTDVNFESFQLDKMMVDAVVRELEIIGEAAKNLGDDFKNKHQVVLWDEMIGMRNNLIHEYFGVDLKIVWETCHDDLPALKKQLLEIIE